jgi:hypothetical protein
MRRNSTTYTIPAHPPTRPPTLSYIPTEALDLGEEDAAVTSGTEAGASDGCCLAVTHTVTSVEVVVADRKGQQHLFAVPRLYDEISKAGAKYAAGKRRITVTLTKSSAFTWANLHRAK